MTVRTGAELLAMAMANESIDVVFGLPCPELDPLLAVLDDHGIRLIPVRHEAAAVHMAEGYYKSTGRVAAVLGNPGPGSANLLPGVLTALHEGTPVLVLTAQHRLEVVYPSTPATFQGQDQVGLFAPTVKWNAPVLDGLRIPELTQMAFREMWNGRPGPVHLDVPAPVLAATVETTEAPIRPPGTYRADPARASNEALDAAAELLANAQRPVIFAGTGVERGDACGQLQTLAEVLRCPVITSQAGRGAMRNDHPQALISAAHGADLARREADVILVVGSRVGNLDTPYDKYWGTPTTKQVIQIDLDPRHIGVTRPVDLAIISDAAYALGAIAARLQHHDASRIDPTDLERYRATAAQQQLELAGPILEWPGPGIHPAHAMGIIGAHFGSDAIYAVDGGNTAVWAYLLLPPSEPRSYLSILELGMLGTGIPSAIGAKLGSPDRTIVCVTGDGAAGFNIMELKTAAREQLSFVTVVFAEGSWTMEEPSQLDRYQRTFGTAQGDIRWDLLAVSLGCYGELVEQLEDLDGALGRAHAHPGPSVICLRTDLDANRALPPGIRERFDEAYTGPT